MYDILTISGSLFEPCDSSSLQNIKIESYEITGQVFRECSMPENESTGLIDLDCAIDETVREKYTEVAANLTCLSHEDNQDFLIDESTPEYFLKALSAVYNSGLPEANFVMKERPIIGRSYCHQTVCLELDKTFDWTQRILNGDKISGNATFDSLVNVAAFEISASEFLGYADLIPTVKAINVDSMATFFTPIEGVISAETCPNNLIGDGGYLSYHSYPDQLQINFSLGYGDCPSGCIYRTNWNFIIHEDCSVVLLENCGNLRPSHNEIGY